MRVCHVIHACSERFSSTLSSPFHPTSSSSHSSSISRTSSCTSSTTLRAVGTLRTSLERRWALLTNPTSSQVMSPKNYDHMETDVESFTESLTHPQFSRDRERGLMWNIQLFASCKVMTVHHLPYSRVRPSPLSLRVRHLEACLADNVSFWLGRSIRTWKDVCSMNCGGLYFLGLESFDVDLRGDAFLPVVPPSDEHVS